MMLRWGSHAGATSSVRDLDPNVVQMVLSYL